MFDHIQKLSFRFFDNNKTGHLIGRITNDLNDIGEVAHHGPEDVFIAIMTLIGAFILMADLNLQLAVITFIIVPIMAWVIIHFGRNMTATYHNLFGNVGNFNARIEDNVGGIRVVQSFANEEHEKVLFAEDNQNFRRTKLMAYKLMAKSSSVSYMMTRLITIVVMICGAWFFIQGELEIGEFVAFILLSNIFFRPIEKSTPLLRAIRRASPGSSAIWKLSILSRTLLTSLMPLKLAPCAEILCLRT